MGIVFPTSVPEIESPSPLSEEIATFLQTRACLVLSAASESLIPELCLGVACLVSPDRLRVRVVFDQRSAAPLLALLPGSGLVALAGSQVLTMRTVQVKGASASLEPLPAAERPRVAESVARMRLEFDKIGFHDPYTVTLLDYDPNELVCVGFTPTAVFDQTPGPQAGRLIDPPSGGQP
jgi:hypothetical protein